jgi:hypothetical protein
VLYILYMKVLIVNLCLSPDRLFLGKFYNANVVTQIAFFKNGVEEAYNLLNNGFPGYMFIMIASENIVATGGGSQVITDTEKQKFLDAMKEVTCFKDNLIVIAGSISYGTEKEIDCQRHYDRAMKKMYPNAKIDNALSDNKYAMGLLQYQSLRKIGRLPPAKEVVLIKNHSYVFLDGRKLGHIGKRTPARNDLTDVAINNGELYFLAGKSPLNYIELPTNPKISCAIEICMDHNNGIAKWDKMQNNATSPLLHFILSNTIASVTPENCIGKYIINSDSVHGMRVYLNMLLMALIDPHEIGFINYYLHKKVMGLVQAQPLQSAYMPFPPPIVCF